MKVLWLLLPTLLLLKKSFAILPDRSQQIWQYPSESTNSTNSTNSTAPKVTVSKLGMYLSKLIWHVTPSIYTQIKVYNIFHHNI